LEIAGAVDQQIFTDSAISEVFRISLGIPRLINTLCDNALLTGYACDSRNIGADIIREVAEDLELADLNRPPARKATSSASVKEPLVGSLSAAEPKPKENAEPKHNAESFDLFVQFVDKLRDRGIKESS
jgi:hypothetical protein